MSDTDRSFAGSYRVLCAASARKAFACPLFPLHIVCTNLALFFTRCRRMFESMECISLNMASNSEPPPGVIWPFSKKAAWFASSVRPFRQPHPAPCRSAIDRFFGMRRNCLLAATWVTIRRRMISESTLADLSTVSSAPVSAHSA